MSDLPALEPLDVESRWRRVADGLDDHGCDVLVVTELANVRYLTGFSGTNAVAVVGADGVDVITDGRYRDQAAEEFAAAGLSGDVALHVVADADTVLADVVGSRRRVGVEANSLSWATARRWSISVLDTDLVPTTDIVSAQRAVKDPGEISRLHRASAIADAALAEVRPLLEEGLTERAFRSALEETMDGLGSHGPSFETIVASGPNAAKPHSRPSDRIIGADGSDMVVIDFGATVDGYHSDMTRSYGVGDVDGRLLEVFDVVRAAQSAGVEAVRAGRRCSDIDAVCREVITAAGYGDRFVHGTGHGIGLEIHERPGLSASSKELLAPRMCITVEPGVYLSGLGGVRIEDSVVVGATGSWHLTSAPYE